MYFRQVHGAFFRILLLYNVITIQMTCMITVNLHRWSSWSVPLILVPRLHCVPVCQCVDVNFDLMSFVVRRGY